MKVNNDFHLGAHPLIFLFGYKRLRISLSRLEDMLNICRTQNITYRFVSVFEDEGYAELCISFFASRRLLSLAKEREIEVLNIIEGGIPALIKKNSHRAGLPIGLLFSICLMVLSSCVIWDIRVDGAIQTSEESVKELLEDCGLSVGKLRRSLNVSAIENRALILSDDICWISINIIGTVAEVEIRESDPPPEPSEGDSAENIVAERGGIIVGFEDARGKIAVNIGDAVAKGDLLIGGIYGDEDNGFRYTAAKGRVLAECELELIADISRRYEKKNYTGREKCEKYLIFFKKEIKFFSNCGNLYTSYDRIDIVEYLTAPNGEHLPFGVRTVRYLEYEYTAAEYSDDELFELADARLDASLLHELEDGELLGVESCFELTDEGYTLRRKIRCIKNIAKRKPIEILP